MERETNIGGSIELGGIKVQELFKELISLYLSGEIREEDVEKRFSSEIKLITKDYRKFRDQTGQLKLTGEMFLLELDRFMNDLRKSEFYKSLEVRLMKMDEDCSKFKVCITVLSAEADFFRASLSNGLLHEEGWDEFLTITE